MNDLKQQTQAKPARTFTGAASVFRALLLAVEEFVFSSLKCRKGVFSLRLYFSGKLKF